MPKYFLSRTVSAVVLLAAGAHLPAFAQSLQSGPDFLEAGQYIDQINKADATYDPYELAYGYALNYKDPDTLVNEVMDLQVPEREGLVDVRITVKADGSVEDVELLGGFYDEEFRQQALNGMAMSTFAPATSAGTPTDWPALEIRIISRGPFLPALTAAMKEDFQRLVQLNIDKKFTEAEPLANELLATQARSLFDYALLQDQLATIYMNTDRLHAALIAMRNATSSSKGTPPLLQGSSRLGKEASDYKPEYLLPDLFAASLEKKALIALALNQTGEAINALADLESRKPVAADNPLKVQIEGVKTKLAGEEPIGSPIKLVQGKWVFETSTRRVFGVTGLNGQVDSIDIACGTSLKRRMAFANDTEFAIPASWQDCKLEFHGTDGAMFNLYEYLN